MMMPSETYNCEVLYPRTHTQARSRRSILGHSQMCLLIFHPVHQPLALRL